LKVHEIISAVAIVYVVPRQAGLVSWGL